MQKTIPARLQYGDEIRVIAPARGIKIIGQDTREIAKKRFEEMGYKVSFGSNTNNDNWDMLGSTSIENRVADIHEAFEDKNVKAIFTIIGGANSNQLLTYLNYDLIKENHKIFCGFSDITALLNAIYSSFFISSRREMSSLFITLIKGKGSGLYFSQCLAISEFTRKTLTASSPFSVCTKTY